MGDDMDDAEVECRVMRGELPTQPKQFRDHQWELVTKMCAFNPSERPRILLVAEQVYMVAADNIRLFTACKGLRYPVDEFRKTILEFLPHDGGSTTQLARGVFFLLADQFVDIYAGRSIVQVESELSPLVQDGTEWVYGLGSTPSAAEPLEIVFKGFSMHHKLDCLLAEHSITLTSQVHQWETKCSQLLQTKASRYYGISL